MSHPTGLSGGGDDLQKLVDRPKATNRAALVKTLVDCPQPLKRFFSTRIGAASSFGGRCSRRSSSYYRITISRSSRSSSEVGSKLR